MITAKVYGKGDWSVVATYARWDDAITGMLDGWNEDEEMSVAILTDEGGMPVATMIRDGADGKWSTLTYANGTTVRYRAHDVKDRAGHRVRTDVRVMEYNEGAGEVTRVP
jgi:hypothetical protein